MSEETRGKQLDYLSERWFVYPRWKGEFCKANTIEQKSKLLPGGPHLQRSSQSRKINSKTLSKGLWKTLLLQALG